MPVYILAILLLIAADQVSKYLVITYLKPIGSFPVLGDFLQLTYAENTGAAFSILENQRWLFITVTAVMTCIAIYFLVTKRLRSRLGNIALCLIVAGGLGNLIDRVIRRFVVDFIYFKSINFAIFNLADSYVVVGAVLICLYIFIFESTQQKKKPEAQK